MTMSEPILKFLLVLFRVVENFPFTAHWLCKLIFPQPTQDTDEVMSDEQIARALQMDEDMEVGC